MKNFATLDAHHPLNNLMTSVDFFEILSHLSIKPFKRVMKYVLVYSFEKGHYDMCEQRRLESAQADQSFHCSHKKYPDPDILVTKM